MIRYTIEYEARDYGHTAARGIVKALRARIKSNWQAMHRYRKGTGWGPDEAWDHEMALRHEEALRLLLSVRRDGMGK